MWGRPIYEGGTEKEEPMKEVKRSLERKNTRVSDKLRKRMFQGPSNW